MGDWSSLPMDILFLISKGLDFLEDLIVFSAVCKSWQLAISTIEQKHHLSSPPASPWLILAEEKKVSPRRHFFRLSSNKVYDFYLPEASERKCLGAGFGWLLTLCNDLEMNLLHPFSRHKIPLPSQSTFPDPFENYPPESLLQIFLRKAVISRNPWKKGAIILSPNYAEKDDCIIMVINGTFCKLAFARLGDKVWNNVQVPSQCYEDIIYYKNQFYAVDCHGLVVRCDLDDKGGPIATIIAPPPEGTQDWIQKYLVELMGDLLLVSRIRGGHKYDEPSHDKGYYTASFSILKMEKNCAQDREERAYEYCWVTVKDLGENALFLGFNSSIALSVSKFNGCFNANCIYFTDDNTELYDGITGGGFDMGIFNMNDGTITSHYRGISLSPISPPFWYI